MPLVAAWYDPHKKKYFQKKSDYTAHLRTVAAARMQKKRVDEDNARFDMNVLALRLAARSTKQIEDWLIANYQTMVTYGRRNQRLVFRDGPSVLESIKIAVHSAPRVSCSHSAPIGKRSNWGGKPGLPSHYAGFSGKIDIEYSGRFFDSDLLKLAYIHTGTGGGGDRKLSYEVKLWEEDYPQLMG